MSLVRLLEDSKNIVGESPLWHPEEESIYWTDINGFRVERYKLASGEKTSWFFGEPVCALSLTTDPARLLVALASKVILWRPSDDERTVFACPEPDWPSNRLNDGVTDPNGVFWVRCPARSCSRPMPKHASRLFFRAIPPPGVDPATSRVLPR